jgi:hypothetical protein
MGAFWAGAAAALLGAIVGGVFTLYATRLQDRRRARAQILVVELRQLHDLVAQRTAAMTNDPTNVIVQDGEVGYRWSTLEVAAATAGPRDLERLEGFQAAWTALGKATTPDASRAEWIRMNEILSAYDAWLRSELHKRFWA